MCLSDIGRVVHVDTDLHRARVDVGGRVVAVSTVALGLDAPPVAIGDWLVVHTGLAVERVDEDAARQVLVARARLATTSAPTNERSAHDEHGPTHR